MPFKVTEAWSGAGLTKGLIDGQWHATRIFHVIGSDGSGVPSKLAVIDAVASQFGVAVGTTHPDSTLMICQTMDCDDNLVRRTVTANYAIDTKGQFDPDPLKAKTRWSWRPGTIPEQSDRDYYGNPYINSAGVPFDQPGQAFYGTMELIATRNEPFYDAQKALRIQNRTNADQFTVQGGGLVLPGQAFLVSMCSETELYDGVVYARVTYNFRFRAGNLIETITPQEYDAFWDKRLDQGDSGWYVESGTTTRGLICNPAGIETGTVLLDGSGKPMDLSLKILSSTSGAVSAPVANPTPLPANVHIAIAKDASDAHLAYYLVRRQFGRVAIETAVSGLPGPLNL